MSINSAIEMMCLINRRLQESNKEISKLEEEKKLLEEQLAKQGHYSNFGLHVFLL